MCGYIYIPPVCFVCVCIYIEILSIELKFNVQVHILVLVFFFLLFGFISRGGIWCLVLFPEVMSKGSLMRKIERKNLNKKICQLWWDEKVFPECWGPCAIYIFFYFFFTGDFSKRGFSHKNSRCSFFLSLVHLVGFFFSNALCLFYIFEVLKF